MAFHALHKGGPVLLGPEGSDSYPAGVPRPDTDIHSSGHTRGATYTSSVVVGKPNLPLYSRFVCGGHSAVPTVAVGDIVGLLTLSVYKTLQSIHLVNRMPMAGMTVDIVKIPLLIPDNEDYVFNRACSLVYCEPSCDFGIPDVDNAVDLVTGYDMGSPIAKIDAGESWIDEGIAEYVATPQAMERETSLIGIRVVAMPDDLRGDACTEDKDFRFDMHMTWFDHCIRTPFYEADEC